MERNKLDEPLGTCTYCGRKGRARNLRKLPPELLADQRASYCPQCYPDVLRETRKLPWNAGK